MQNMQNEFFLTLLSNSSMEYFPNNKTSQFTTQLPNSIHLEGEWQVGLTEFQYPCSLLTVRKTQNIIYFKELKDAKTYVYEKVRINTGSYDNINDLLEVLNSNTHIIGRQITFEMNKSTHKVHVDIPKANSVVSMTFSTYLALQLGFEPDQNMLDNRHALHPSNIILGLPSQFFIYCDIISPQFVGDSLAKLLRNVSVDNSKYIYGSQKMKLFSPTHYVPVLKREFENIEIDIRTETGEIVPFLFGTVSVKLHFKRIK